MKLWTRFTIHFLAGWEWVDVGFILQQFHTFMRYLKLHKLWSDWKHNSVFWHIHTIQIHFTRSHEMQFLHTTFRGPLKCNSIQIITDYYRCLTVRPLVLDFKVSFVSLAAWHTMATSQMKVHPSGSERLSKISQSVIDLLTYSLQSINQSKPYPFIKESSVDSLVILN